MRFRSLLGFALTLTALGLAPGAAHLMELPVKLDYAPQMYASVTSTLYAWFGIIGGSVQVAAVVAVGILAFANRRTPRLRGMMAASAAALLMSLVLWGLLVFPVNSEWAEISASNSAEIAAAYDRLRSRWEFGHVAAFIAWLTGWVGLVATVTLRDIPKQV